MATMRYLLAAIGVVGASLWIPTAADGQGLRDVGGGPSQQFIYYLPSSGINRTLSGSGLGGYASARDYISRPGPGGASYLAAPGIDVYMQRGGWGPVGADDLSPGFAPSGMARVRSIDSMSFEKRGRFAKLRETTLALEERLRKSEPASLGQVSLSFRQFMFPFPMTDAPDIGYGFFSRLDVVGGGTVPPEAFLSPFSADVQQSLSDKRFLDLLQALVTTGRPAADGMKLEQCYDPQLAALGNYLFNNGRYAASATAWGLLTERNPTNVTARRALGLSLLAGRQMKRAAAELRRSMTLMPGWPDKVKVTGSNLQDVFPNTRDLVDARGEVEAQLAKQPDDADLGFLEAFLDLFQGRWSAAEERLAKLAATDEVAKGLLALLKKKAVAETVRRPAGSALRRAADAMTGLEEPPLSPEARGQLIAVLRNGATTYEDYMRLGDFRFFMGDFTAAGESYRAAHKAKPDNPFALFAMTHAAFANSEYRQAVRYLEEALAIEPNWGLYEFRLQEFYGDAQEFERQLKNLERQAELRSQSADLKFLLAYIYYFSGRYSDAGDVLAQVLRLEPAFKKADYFLRLSKLQG
jgi:tetratricopeptide (TPR) repeat protein